MYQLEGREFSKLVCREFTETATEVHHSGKQDGLFECYTSNIRSSSFDIMRFRSGFAEDLQVNDFRDNTHVSLHFQLSGGSKASISGIRASSVMEKGYFNLFNCVNPVSTFVFPRQKEYEYLCVGLQPVFFDDLLQQCGETYRQFLEKSQRSEPFSLFPNSLHISYLQWNALRLLLEPPVADTIKAAYIRAKVEELTLLSLGMFQEKRAGINPLKASEINSLRQVKDFLDQHFNDELNLTQLSRLFLLNEFKLKSGFRQLFGTSVFGYIHQKRMGFARQMLTESRMTVREVAAAAGYESDTSFIRAFRLAFGMSPGKLKR